MTPAAIFATGTAGVVDILKTLLKPHTKLKGLQVTKEIGPVTGRFEYGFSELVGDFTRAA